MNNIEEYLTENPALIPKRVSMLIKKTEMLKMGGRGVKGKMIQNLLQTNLDLDKKIEISVSDANCLKDYEQINSVKDLVKEMEILDGCLKTEKNYIRDLEDQIQIDQLKYETVRKKHASSKKSVRFSSMKDPEKCKESNQQKLYAISVQLGTEQTQNTELRENIKALMSERKKFNKEFNELLEKLESGKEYMQELNKSVRNVLHSRENIQNKLSILHEREIKQKKSQEEEMRDLKMRENHEAVCKRFLNKKFKVRQLIRSETKKIANKNESILKKLESYQSVLKSISNMYVEENLKENFHYHDIIDHIKTREEQNMSLFNFATNQYDELQALREKVLNQERLFEEKFIEQECEVALHEAQRENLESLVSEVEERKLCSIDEIRTGHKLLEKLFGGIDHLVKLTKADTSAITLLLGDNNKTTQFNYKLFLQALETRVIGLLALSNLLPREPRVSQKTKSQLGEKCRTYQSVDKSVGPFDIESKVNLTRPCLQCFPLKRESTTTM